MQQRADLVHPYTFLGFFSYLQNLGVNTPPI